MDEWVNFGIAVTSASAALIGLLVVALSINLEQVVRSEQLPSRALLALLMLWVPLVAGLLLIVPQSSRAYGIELLILGAVMGAWMGALARPASRPPEQSRVAWFAGDALPAAVIALATLVTGVLLVAGHPTGLFGLPVVVLVAFAGSLIGTWVLLVEILR